MHYGRLCRWRSAGPRQHDHGGLLGATRGHASVNPERFLLYRDGGHIDEANYVTLSDRKKDVIISGGENVSSIEVEDAIFQHPDVAEVAVIGIPDEKW